MPFLRAALIKKKLQPEPEPIEFVEPPVVEDEPEPEEEFTQIQIEGLQGIIDKRTEESELTLPESVQEVEEVTVTPEPEPVQEDLPQETVTPEAEVEPEISQPVTETEPEVTEETVTPESDDESETSQPEPEPEAEDSQPEQTHKDYSGSQLDYDFTSGERYVDKVSTKTEFDRMLDELAAISKDLLTWQAEKFARDYASKFSEGESSQAEARKYEAFLGGYITNAAMLLYDKGYRDAAIKQLEQAISILQARKKLEDETSAIKSRVEEQNDAVDLSDILGLFGDG